MGFLFSKIWSKLFSQNREFKILILGLANAGKTTILYQFNLGKNVQTHPTIGNNIEEVKNKNVKLQVWDLGGQESLRSTWSSYFQSTNGVIFVIDASDRKSEETAQVELFNVLADMQLKNATFLIFANKQDVEGAMDAGEVTEKFKLTTIKNHEWHIQACTATSGAGLKEGLDWLTERLITKRN